MQFTGAPMLTASMQSQPMFDPAQIRMLNQSNHGGGWDLTIDGEPRPILQPGTPPLLSAPSYLLW